MKTETYYAKGVAVHVYEQHDCALKLGTIVFVHGGNHQAKAWDRWARFFQRRGYDVLAIDWLNHGLSTHLPEKQFIERSIAHVAFHEITEVIRSWGDDPILIGHSMGGMASLIYAEKNPLSLRRMVLVAPTPMDKVEAKVVEVPVDWDAPFEVPPFEVAKGMFWQGIPDEQAWELYKDLVRESPLAVWEATRYTLHANVRNFMVPTLVVSAGQDTLYPPATAVKTAELLDAAYHNVSISGHSDILLNMEAASAVFEWVTDC